MFFYQEIEADELLKEVLDDRWPQLLLETNEANKNLVYVRAYNENLALHKLPPNTQVFGEIYGVQDIKFCRDVPKGTLYD